VQEEWLSAGSLANALHNELQSTLKYLTHFSNFTNQKQVAKPFEKKVLLIVPLKTVDCDLSARKKA